MSAIKSQLELDSLFRDYIMANSELLETKQRILQASQEYNSALKAMQDSWDKYFTASANAKA